MNLLFDLLHIIIAFLFGSLWGFIGAYFYWRDRSYTKKVYIYKDSNEGKE